jgi:hypothetical protein
MLILHEIWRSQNAVIFQFVAVIVVKPSSLLGGCQFLGGTCFLHIQDQSEWGCAVRLHGKVAMDIGY